MYIEPNSQVQFFSDIGISQNYDTALYFSSTNEKDAYFNNLDKIASFSKVSYSRSNKGVIRLEANILALYDAGYMRFKNTSFENKWFYAFVDSVEYINNTTVEIK